MHWEAPKTQGVHRGAWDWGRSRGDAAVLGLQLGEPRA